MTTLGKRLPAGLIDSGGDGENNAQVRRMYEILKRNASEQSEHGADDELENGEEEGAFGYDADAEEDVEELDSDDEIGGWRWGLIAFCTKVSQSSNAHFVADLADRLKDIDLDDANAVWECLTDAERKDFESVVHGEHVSKLSVREPWWRKWEIDGEKPAPLIQDVTEPTDSAPKDRATKTTKPITTVDRDPSAIVVDDMPAVLDRISDFSQLTGRKSPAAGIEHNIKNVIGAYCLTYRFYYGDLSSHVADTCTYLFARCGNLRSNVIYKSAESAMLDVNPNGDPNLLQLITEDTDSIWLGPPLPEPRPRQQRIHATQAALSDVHRLLAAARHITPKSTALVSADAKVASDDTTATKARIAGRVYASGAPVSRVFLSACLKKMEYYLSSVQQLQ